MQHMMDAEDVVEPALVVEDLEESAVDTTTGSLLPATMPERRTSRPSRWSKARESMLKTDAAKLDRLREARGWETVVGGVTLAQDTRAWIDSVRTREKQQSRRSLLRRVFNLSRIFSIERVLPAQVKQAAASSQSEERRSTLTADEQAEWGPRWGVEPHIAPLVALLLTCLGCAAPCRQTDCSLLEEAAQGRLAGDALREHCRWHLRGPW